MKREISSQVEGRLRLGRRGKDHDEDCDSDHADSFEKPVLMLTIMLTCHKGSNSLPQAMARIMAWVSHTMSTLSLIQESYREK
jgi:hypothetical protein